MVEDYTICWYGPVYSVSGYGTASRAYLNTLRDLGHRIKVYNTGKVEKEFLDTELIKWLEKLEQNEIKGKKIVLIHDLPTILERLEIRDALFCALITIFETDRIPRFWVNLLNRRFVDEVWVPSQFNINTFHKSGVKNEKLFKLPYPMDVSDEEPKSNRENTFRILYIADFNPRKNMRQLVEAYKNEFGGLENVELFLHTTTNLKEEQERFKDSLGDLNNPRVNFSMEKLNDAAIKSLISTADLYISTDKANGWGMPVMEAMAMGVSVATVNWSGSTEFTSHKNSFLIEPTGLEPVSFEIASRSHLYLKQKWAVLDTASIQNVMRVAYENTRLRRELAVQAKKDILAFSSETIRQRMIGHLESIVRRLNTSAGKNLRKTNHFHLRLVMLKRNLFYAVQLKLSYPGYFNLTMHIRKTAAYYFSKKGTG